MLLAACGMVLTLLHALQAENLLQIEAQKLPNLTHPDSPVGGEDEAAELQVVGTQRYSAILHFGKVLNYCHGTSLFAKRPCGLCYGTTVKHRCRAAW